LDLSVAQHHVGLRLSWVSHVQDNQLHVMPEKSSNLVLQRG